MLTLINANRMTPPIAPVGLDYVAGAVRLAGEPVEILDLCLAENPQAALTEYFAKTSPELVGISFRNIDDCFWPGEVWFVPEMVALVAEVRRLTGAPIVLGGVGFSIFAEQIVVRTGADFGIRGDGERAPLDLLAQLRGPRRFDNVAGLVWREGDRIHANAPAWPRAWSAATARDALDNGTYLRRGGQIGIETKRGCDRQCIYCADPLAKGTRLRPRDPHAVADEFESLLAQGCDVFHLCDSEFNLPREDAHAVCEALIARRLGERVRWYAYLATMPFDAELARLMRRAGCVGINFTGDAASASMLAAYRQPHRSTDLAQNVRHCRDQGIAVMLDLLLGGPGETPESAAETIEFVRRADPDCAGVALGIRVYPHTPMTAIVAAEGPLETNPHLHRHYQGPIDFLRPTFYVSQGLGPKPAQLVRDLIGGDPRFFEPADDEPPAKAASGPESDSGYNYNENTALAQAIAQGARGAYWDILRRLRGGKPG